MVNTEMNPEDLVQRSSNVFRPDLLWLLISLVVFVPISILVSYGYVWPIVSSLASGDHSISRDEWESAISLSAAFLLLPIWYFWRIAHGSPAHLDANGIRVGVLWRRRLGWGEVVELNEDNKKLVIVGTGRKVIINKTLYADPEGLVAAIRRLFSESNQSQEKPSELC